MADRTPARNRGPGGGEGRVVREGAGVTMPLRPVDPNPPPCPECGGAPGHHSGCSRDGLRALAVSPDGTPLGHVEPDGRFVPALTDRERACLRGEHEATGDMDSTAGLAVWLGERAGEAWCCRHCRTLFVPRSP